MKTLFLLTLILLTSFTVEAQRTRIDPYLQTKLSEPNTKTVPAYAVLRERISLDYLVKLTGDLPKKEKQREVVRILQEFAAQKQAAVLGFLNEQKAQNHVSNINVIWINNVISFESTPGVIYSLAANFPEIESIHFDAQFPFSMLQDDEGITQRNNNEGVRLEPLYAPQQGLILINAPQVWAAGDSGAGVLVGNLDSGCDWAHPDLVNNIWCNPGEDANGNGKAIIWNGSAYVFDPGDLNGVDNDGNGLVDDLVGWDHSQGDMNPYNGSSSSSHGTATSGIVMGYGTNGTQTGVAPRAKMIAMVPGGESQYWAAQQYCIAKGVDIITSSLSYKWYFNPQPNYPMFRQTGDMELAAGIIHTNSTSNDGGYSGAPIPFNISAPGNNPGPWIHPDQTLVGGLCSVIGAANVSATTDVIVSSSPYGPATWENIQTLHPSYPYTMPANYQDYPYETIPGSMGLIKPDVAAPGNNTVSTAPNGGYQSFSGTSGATPHLAGVAALMIGVNNLLTPAGVSRIMQITSVEKGTPGKDNRYGAGRVNAWDAIQRVKLEIPVELVSFGASVSEGTVTLSWMTATETNNKGFEIIRLSFGKEEAVGFVEGHGTTTSTNSYSFTDKLNTPGFYTYRLKQVDFDGTYQYSKEVSVEVTIPAVFSVEQNYPNPFNPATMIKYSIPADGFVNLTVFNMLGETVKELVNQEAKAGTYTVTFDASDLNSGVYFYKLQTGNFSQTRKMILSK